MYRTSFDSTKKIWSGPKQPMIFNERLSIGNALLWTLQRNPQKIGQISANNGIELTNAEIYMRTIRAAQNIKRLGLKEGDVIGVAARNSHNMAPIVFAGMCIGCPVHALDPTFDKIELTGLLSITKPKLLFCDLGNLDIVKSSLSELKMSPILFTFDGASDHSRAVEELLLPTNIEHEFTPIQFDDGAKQTAVILCSSGTTGPSKGVCVSHAALLDRATNWMPLRTDDRLFCFSSLYWLSGMSVLLMGTLIGCTRVITTDTFDSKIQLKTIEKYKVTVIFSVPDQLAMMMDHPDYKQTDISSVRDYACGGTPVSSEICTRFRKRLRAGNVHTCYGMTEVAGLVSSNRPPVPDAIGQIGPNLSVKIVDNDGKQCGANEEGEICIKSSYPLLSYFGNDEATKNAFDADGWFLSGDIGRFDDAGNMYFVDRKKEIFKSFLHSISPAEIEKILVKHPAVTQACVVGVPVPAAQGGCVPAVAIVLKYNTQLTENDVHAFLDGKVSEHKKIRAGVYFVDSLPATPSGKVLRRVMRESIIKWHSERKNA